jgi:hypothetical protein
MPVSQGGLRKYHKENNNRLHKLMLYFTGNCLMQPVSWRFCSLNQAGLCLKFSVSTFCCEHNWTFCLLMLFGSGSYAHLTPP